MDPNGLPSHQHSLGPTPSGSRKRSRENETPSQRHKREKAAERQRRKRERDRQAGLNSVLSLSQVQQPIPEPEPPIPEPQSISEYKGDDLSPEEVARRERVRAAARERQRKHRLLVKQKKLRELGLDMGNDIIPGLEDVQYRMNAEGQYQAVMPHEVHPHPHPHPHAIHEPPFPQGQPLGGQTFASTLLLSFSCAPLLKQHLLRTLSMTNEELASLEPIIAQAWDHWDQQRRMHYAHHPANAPKPPEANVSDPNVGPYPPMAEHSVNHPFVHDGPPGAPNDFRARFHRPLVAPSPFRTAVVPPEAQQPNGAPSSSNAASGPPTESLDPHLTTNLPNPAEQRLKPPGIDPQLGQARNEAADVAGKLER